MRGGKLSVRAISAQTGIDHQHFHPIQRSRSRIAYECIEPVTAVLDLPETTRASRVTWQEIESIEPRRK